MESGDLDDPPIVLETAKEFLAFIEYVAPMFNVEIMAAFE
jgi:hypothetical protein